MVHYEPSTIYYVLCTYHVLGTKDIIQARLSEAQDDSLNVSSNFFQFPYKLLHH